MEDKRIIKSFLGLDVYKNLFDLMRVVMAKLIPRLPKEEKYDLADQMRRACKRQQHYWPKDSLKGDRRNSGASIWTTAWASVTR